MDSKNDIFYGLEGIDNKLETLESALSVLDLESSRKALVEHVVNIRHMLDETISKYAELADSLAN